jgi:hypothetical protein
MRLWLDYIRGFRDPGIVTRASLRQFGDNFEAANAMEVSRVVRDKFAAMNQGSCSDPRVRSANRLSPALEADGAPTALKVPRGPNDVQTAQQSLEAGEPRFPSAGLKPHSYSSATVINDIASR